MRILFVGHGRCGKDTAGKYLESITPLKFAGTTSEYLAPYVAAKTGQSVEDAYDQRHDNRDLWYRTGREVRAKDPGILIRESMKNGEIGGGVRDFEEIIAARCEGLVDLIVWIENLWVPVDPTVKFTARECDLVIQNNWGESDFNFRLLRFASACGLLKKT